MSSKDFPYTMSRCGIVMRPERSDPHEVEGVLNPAAGWAPDGRLMLFSRVVGEGNWSRIAVADVVVTDGVPTGVERRGIALAPDRGWERGSDHGGVEDPRITWLEPLGIHVMTYVAFGPRGPQPALVGAAVGRSLSRWLLAGFGVVLIGGATYVLIESLSFSSGPSRFEVVVVGGMVLFGVSAVVVSWRSIRRHRLGRVSPEPGGPASSAGRS